MEYKKVTLKEFNHFINNYIRCLDVDVVNICVPPIRTFHDLQLPDNDQLIGKVDLNFMLDGSQDEYYLRDD